MRANHRANDEFRSLKMRLLSIESNLGINDLLINNLSNDFEKSWMEGEFFVENDDGRKEFLSYVKCDPIKITPSNLSSISFYTADNTLSHLNCHEYSSFEEIIEEIKKGSEKLKSLELSIKNELKTLADSEMALLKKRLSNKEGITDAGLINDVFETVYGYSYKDLMEACKND